MIAITERLSARVDPGLIEATRARSGLCNDSELVNAALAVLAAPDDFGPWFAARAGRLPKDFALELSGILLEQPTHGQDDRLSLVAARQHFGGFVDQLHDLRGI